MRGKMLGFRPQLRCPLGLFPLSSERVLHIVEKHVILP